MSVIITRPNYDITTRYISAWAEEVIKFAQEKSIKVTDLENTKVNKEDFESRIKKLEPKVLFLNGHGAADCIVGQDHKVIVKAGENHNVLQGKITYALSCESAKKLGKEVVKDGKSTYIGYMGDFAFVGDVRYSTRPLEDPKAKLFMEASNLVMLCLLKGNTAKQASDKSKTKFREHITKLYSSLADPDTLQAVQCLFWNMRYQVCLGQESASI